MSNKDHYGFWFYGCLESVKPGLYLPSGSHATWPKNCPEPFSEDCLNVLFRDGDEGAAGLFISGNWTVLGYLDGSHGGKMASPSVFLARGVYPSLGMMALALDCFPGVLLRRKVQIKILPDPNRPKSVVEKIREEGGPEEGVAINLDSIPDDHPSPEALEELRVAYEARLAQQSLKMEEHLGIGLTPVSEDETDVRMPDVSTTIELGRGHLGTVVSHEVTQPPPKPRKKFTR